MNHLNELLECQYNAVIGSLLGDGSIIWYPQHGYKNAAFVKRQITKEYLLSLFNCLQPFSGKQIHSVKVKGNRKPCWSILTTRHSIFTQLRHKWYNKSIKVIPKDLVINPEIVAWWFCDDGFNDWRGRRVVIYSQSFTADENEFLSNQLNKIGIKSKVGRTKGGTGYNINIKSNGYFDFIDMMKPFVGQWSDMHYKIDTHSQNQGINKNNGSGFNGVSWNKERKKWDAHIKVNYKKVFLGRFALKEEAIYARMQAEENYNYRGKGRK